MKPQLTNADRDKLAKLLAMFGSNHAGERDAAALAAHRLVTSRGLTWSDVLGSGQRWELPPEIVRAADEARAAQRGVIDDLRLCVRHIDSLKNWEQSFVASVAVRTRRSPKQTAVVKEIAAGLRARGLA